MNFLYPTFLYALAVIAIPVIIHLFNFRRYKTEYFSNIRFLRNIKQQTKSKSQLKHLLVLICRILAIAALVIAFAQPYIPLTENAKVSKNNIVSIYIDNSFSMDAESKYGNLLEAAKSKAKNIIDAYQSDTKFLLLTNDFELKHQHLVNKEQFMDYLSEIEVSPDVRNISEVYSRQHDFLSLDKDTNEQRNSIFIISDFQKSSSDFKQIKNDTGINVNLLPLATQPTNNLYIESCWFETPCRKYNQKEELFVKIVNKSDESYNDIPVKLYINDSVKALGSFNIDKYSSEIVELSYTNTQTGILHGKIEIQDYPITYDNIFYFGYNIADKIALLTINEDTESKFINALFSEDDYITITNFNKDNIKSSQFSNYHTIILNEIKEISSGLAQELINYLSGGGLIVFFPNIEGEIESYNTFLKTLKTNYITRIDTHKTQIKTINYNNEIYKNVFKKTEDNIELPVIHQHFVFTRLTRTNITELLTSQNKHPILSMMPYGRGKIYISAIPLSEEYSNFTKHPVFVPTLYNIALNSQPASQIYYTIGKDEVIEINNSNIENYNIFHIINSSNTFDFIPQHNTGMSGANISLSLQQNISTADNYVVTNNNKPVTCLAFNYNRNESDLSYYQKGDITEMLEELDYTNFTIIDTNNKFLTKTLSQINKGKQLWKLFILITLFFIGLEIALLRFWK